MLRTDVVVIGAGQAGLSAAYHLRFDDEAGRVAVALDPLAGDFDHGLVAGPGCMVTLRPALDAGGHAQMRQTIRHKWSTAMTEPNDPTATVKRMFAAFGAGDIDALLETVRPDSHWTYYGANPRRTKAEFTGTNKVRRFFERILERLEMTEFNTDEFIEEGETVVIFGSEAGTVRPTGEPFRNAWAQRYVVRDNLIVEMVEYNIQVEPRESR